MDKFCEDCIHNEVCQYYAIPPHKDRCNDKDTLDDLIPQGEWTFEFGNQAGLEALICTNCGHHIYNNGFINLSNLPKFCENCGAKMRKGGTEA